MANKKVVGELIYQIRGDDTQYSKVINRADVGARKLGKTVNGVSTKMIKSLVGVFVAWQALKKGIDATIGSAIRYEDAFAGVRKTVDGTEKQLKALSDQFVALSKEIPISANEFAKIGELAGQLGVPIKQINKFAETIAKVAVTTNLTTEQASTDFARFANIMGMPLENVDRLASSLVALGNNSATTESEIIAMSLRIAGAGSTLGLTVDQVLAWSSALSSVGIQAQMGGTAFSKMLIDISSMVSTGSKKLEKFARVAGLSADDFTKSFKEDANGAMQLFFKGLNKVKEEGGDLLAVIDALDITEVRLRDTVLRLAGGYEGLDEQLAISKKATEENTALNIEAAKRFGTTASQIQLLKNNVNALTLTLGNAFIPMLNGTVIPFLIDLFDRISKVSGAMSKLNAQMGGVSQQYADFEREAQKIRGKGVLTLATSVALDNAEKELKLNKELIEGKIKLQRIQEILGRAGLPKEKDREYLESVGILEDKQFQTNQQRRKITEKALLDQAESVQRLEYEYNKSTGAIEKFNVEILGQKEKTENVIEKTEDLIKKLIEGETELDNTAESAEKLTDNWGKLKDETVDLSDTGITAMEDLANESVKDLEKIEEKIESLRKKIKVLQADLAIDIAEQDIGIAEKIVAEERKIADLKKKLEQERAEEKPDRVDIAELTAEIKAREDALRKSADLQAQLDEEIIEARRRASITDIERSIEDFLLKKEQTQIEFEKKKKDLENELVLEEENRTKIVNLEKLKQEQITRIIDLANQRFQDLANNRVKITEDEVTKQMAWYAKLAKAIASSKKATRVSELPQFHQGGYVRTGGEVHAGEYVIPANMVNQFGGVVKALEGIRQGGTTNNSVTMNNNITEQIDMDAVLKGISFELNK